MIVRLVRVYLTTTVIIIIVTINDRADSFGSSGACMAAMMRNNRRSVRRCNGALCRCPQHTPHVLVTPYFRRVWGGPFSSRLEVIGARARSVQYLFILSLSLSAVSL